MGKKRLRLWKIGEGKGLSWSQGVIGKIFRTVGVVVFGVSVRRTMKEKEERDSEKIL